MPLQHQILLSNCSDKADTTKRQHYVLRLLSNLLSESILAVLRFEKHVEVHVQIIQAPRPEAIQVLRPAPNPASIQAAY